MAELLEEPLSHTAPAEETVLEPCEKVLPPPALPPKPLRADIPEEALSPALAARWLGRFRAKSIDNNMLVLEIGYPEWDRNHGGRSGKSSEPFASVADVAAFMKTLGVRNGYIEPSGVQYRSGSLRGRYTKARITVDDYLKGMRDVEAPPARTWAPDYWLYDPQQFVLTIIGEGNMQALRDAGLQGVPLVKREAARGPGL